MAFLPLKRSNTERTTLLPEIDRNFMASIILKSQTGSTQIPLRVIHLFNAGVNEKVFTGISIAGHIDDQILRNRHNKSVY